MSPWITPAVAAGAPATRLTTISPASRPTAFDAPAAGQRLQHPRDGGARDHEHAAAGAKRRHAEQSAGRVQNRPALLVGGQPHVQADKPVDPAPRLAVPARARPADDAEA